jgi:hypothetical protein
MHRSPDTLVLQIYASLCVHLEYAHCAQFGAPILKSFHTNGASFNFEYFILCYYVFNL